MTLDMVDDQHIESGVMPMDTLELTIFLCGLIGAILVSVGAGAGMEPYLAPPRRLCSGRV